MLSVGILAAFEMGDLLLVVQVGSEVLLVFGVLLRHAGGDDEWDKDDNGDSQRSILYTPLPRGPPGDKLTDLGDPVAGRKSGTNSRGGPQTDKATGLSRLPDGPLAGPSKHTTLSAKFTGAGRKVCFVRTGLESSHFVLATPKTPKTPTDRLTRVERPAPNFRSLRDSAAAQSITNILYLLGMLAPRVTVPGLRLYDISRGAQGDAKVPHPLRPPRKSGLFTPDLSAYTG